MPESNSNGASLSPTSSLRSSGSDKEYNGVKIHLRAETKNMEHRAALTPTTASQLINLGFEIAIEDSELSIFNTKDYQNVGCKVVKTGSWKDAPDDEIILGLKELPHESFPLKHEHIMFAHCYKYQSGWQDVLRRFIKGHGTLYDLEFLKDASGKRVAAFGYYAGFAGAAVGLLDWAHKIIHPGKHLHTLEPYDTQEQLVDYVKDQIAKARKAGGKDVKLPTIIVIGALGRCGTGACDLCIEAGVPTENISRWDMKETQKGGPFKEILDHDIFINCIYLSHKIAPFITKEEIQKAGKNRKLSAIVDVSADTTNPFNPVPVYDVATTFDKPTVPVEVPEGTTLLSVCSIDHLPSLLPRESSESFSLSLLPSLIELPHRDEAPVWVEAKKLFEEKCQEVEKGGSDK